MKKLLLIMLAVSALTGCTTRTDYGECVGVGGSRDPALHYRLDTWNVLWAVIFFETAVVPLVVILDDAYCPVAKKVTP